MDAGQSNRSRDWIPWWIPLLIGGVVMADFFLLNGYIHPDEFFQSSEVIVGRYFKVVHYEPWEYSGHYPCRSVLFPITIFLLSGGFLRDPKDAYSSFTLCAIAVTLTVKRIVYTMDTMKKPSNPGSVLCAAALWTFMLKPFSNSVETLLLSYLVYYTFPSKSRLVAPNAKEIGIILAVGFFNRPTFAFFAAVPVLSWLYDGYRHSKPPRQLWSSGVFRMIKSGFVASVMCIALDTVYFGYYNWKWQCGLSRDSPPKTLLDVLVHSFTGCFSSTPLHPVLSPLNWLAYNMKSSNLAEHGLHPRITHIAVNMPLMFGALAIIFYVATAHYLVSRDLKNTVAKFVCPPAVITLHPHLNGQNSRNQPGYSWQESEWRTMRHAAVYLLGSILVPLLALSAAPHQEARFLLPLIVPLSIAFSHHLTSSRLVYNIAVIHLLAAMTFFGLFHQGGVVAALRYQGHVLHSSLYSTSPVPYEHHLLYFRTYMPPRTILGWPQKNASQLHVHDLGGSAEEKLHQLVERLHCSAAASDRPHHLWLLAPASILLSDWVVRNEHCLNITLEARFAPHFNSEALPGWWTRAHCLPKDDICQADVRLQSSLANFFAYSLHLFLYRIEFLFGERCKSCSSNPYRLMTTCSHMNCSSILPHL